MEENINREKNRFSNNTSRPYRSKRSYQEGLLLAAYPTQGAKCSDFWPLNRPWLFGEEEQYVILNFVPTQNWICVFNFGYAALTPLHGCSRSLFSLFAVAIGRMRPPRVDLLPPQRRNTGKGGWGGAPFQQKTQVARPAGSPETFVLLGGRRLKRTPFTMHVLTYVQ